MDTGAEELERQNPKLINASLVKVRHNRPSFTLLVASWNLSAAVQSIALKKSTNPP
jgi:hypothetical protein